MASSARAMTALSRVGQMAPSSRIATRALSTASKTSARPSIAMKLNNSGRIAFRRAYADEAPKPKPKPGKIRRTLRWTWRFTYLSLGALVGYTCYVIYDDRHPQEQYQPDPSKKTLVVLGSGWGSVGLLKNLDTENYNVIVVSPRNYFLFTPLLPSCTTGLIEHRSIMEPVRTILRHKKGAVKYYEAEASSVDPDRKVVKIKDNTEGKGPHSQTEIPYDMLVIGVGAENATFGIPGVRENSCFLKEIGDAQLIRKKIMDCVERASFKGQSQEEIDRLMHMVVVGGGPTGVEFAGELRDFFEDDIKKLIPEISQRFKVTLIEALPNVLPSFSKQLIEYTENTLREENIDIKLKTMVKRVTEDFVEAECAGPDGSKQTLRIPYGLLVWATGNAVRPIVRDLMSKVPAQKDSRRGLAVNEYLVVQGTRDIWAVGDCAVAGYAPDDGSMYGFVINVDGPDLPKDESTNQFLIPRMKKLPSKMFRSIVHDKDFEVSLAYESKDLLPPGTTSLTFAQYAVEGLADANERYASRNISAPIKANLHFSLSRSGTFSLDRVDAVIEISEWVEVPRKNLTVDDSNSTAANVSAESSPKNTTEDSDDKLDVEGASSDSSNSTANNSSTADLGAEKKLKKRTFRIPLKIIEKTTGPAMSFSDKSFSEAKLKLEELDKKDAERRRTAELKNNLESYIYDTRDKIESEEFAKISTDQERKSYIEKLDEVQEWLYTDGEDASATEFEKKLDLLKAIGDPIFHRYNELTARPAASEHARRYLTELQQIVQKWETDKSWLPRGKIDEVLAEAEKLKSWLNEKEAEQAKTPGYSKPVFTSEEVYTKLFDLQDKVAKVNKIPKPKPKVEKPTTNGTENNGQKEKAGSSSEEPSQKEQTGDSEKPASGDKPSAESNGDGQPGKHDEL